MISNFNIANWYWAVAGSTTQVYSSAGVAYVPVADATYQAWLATNSRPAKVGTEQELWDALLARGVAVPVGVVPSDALKEGMFANVPHAVQVWAFDVDNRVRVLEGQPTRSASQFKNYVKSLL